MTTALIPAVRDVEAAEEREADLVTTMDRLQGAIVDAKAPSLSLTAVENTYAPVGGSIWARGVIEADAPESELPIRLNILRGAHQQIASKLDIPFKYYQRMLEHDSDLWAESVNAWLWREHDKTRLLRMLRPMDEAQEGVAAMYHTQYNLRAFLSDRYHIIDHKALLDAILPVLREKEAYVTDWNLDEQHFHLRFSTQEVEVLQAFWEEQPRLRGMEEIVSFGGAMRNSETGHGAYRLGPAVNIKRCVNVLVTTERLRIVHLGGRSVEEEHFFQEDTKVMDDSATILKVRDRLAHIFSDESIEKVAKTIVEGHNTPFDPPEKLNYIEFVGNIGRGFKLADDEVEVLQEEFTNEVVATNRVLNRGSSHRPTRWTVAQALTATARRLADENPEMDFDRREEIETAGWEVLTSPTSRLLKAAKARTN